MMRGGSRRRSQKAAFNEGATPPPYSLMSDNEIRETLEANQLRLLRERSADMTIFCRAHRQWARMSATRLWQRGGRR